MDNLGSHSAGRAQSDQSRRRKLFFPPLKIISMDSPRLILIRATALHRGFMLTSYRR
jgi:hypothetical protein